MAYNIVSELRKYGLSPVPAVVVGMNLGGLGVTRSLAKYGVPVIAVDQDAAKSEMKTRFAKTVVVSDLRGERLIDDLVNLGKTLEGRAPIIPTQRLPSRLISEWRERLEPYFSLVMSEHQLIEACENKVALLDLLKDSGLKMSRTSVLTPGGSVSVLAELTYPCIIKPEDNDVGYSARFKKAYKVFSQEEAQPIVEEILEASYTLVVQEWIEGGPENLYFCLQYRDRTGVLQSSFVGQKMRIWPEHFGPTASCTIATEYQSEIEQFTNSFFDRLGHIGFGSVEFKLHSGTGEWYMIEPTAGRTDQQEEVCSLNGIEVPLIGYLDHIEALPYFDLAQLSESKSKKAIWRVTPDDRYAVSVRGRNSSKDFSSGRRFHDALWRFNDPAPGVDRFIKRLKLKLS